MRLDARAWAGSALVLGGLLLATVPGFFLVHSVGTCADLAARGITFARLSEGGALPVPIVQNCTGASLLFGLFYAGFLTCAAGTLTLLRARLTVPLVAFLSVTAILAAAAVPFFPNADPYAYALYAYVPVVLKQTPYAVQHLDAAGVGGVLGHLFPPDRNPIRVANYGPVFVWINAAAVGPFGFISLKAMLAAERAFGALCVVLLGTLLARTQREPEAKLKAFAATVLNPLLLFESVSFTHGDVIMLVFLAAAYLAYTRKRIWLCAALCILAFETRSVAAAASVVLLWDLASRKEYRAAAAAVVASAVTLAATWMLAQITFGSFGHALGFFYAAENAPGTLLAALFMGATQWALSVGLIIGVGIAAAIAYVAFREKLYELVALAVLVVLPGIEPWYLQWLAPVAVVSRNAACRATFVAFMLLAPLGMFVEMTAQFNYPLVHGVTVAVQWGTVILVYAWMSIRTKPAYALTR